MEEMYDATKKMGEGTPIGLGGNFEYRGSESTRKVTPRNEKGDEDPSEEESNGESSSGEETETETMSVGRSGQAMNT